MRYRLNDCLSTCIIFHKSIFPIIIFINNASEVFCYACMQVFEQATVLFSDVSGFINICTNITPMQVVTMLNIMYTAFDTIIEKHQCYKVSLLAAIHVSVIISSCT